MGNLRTIYKTVRCASGVSTATVSKSVPFTERSRVVVVAAPGIVLHRSATAESPWMIALTRMGGGGRVTTRSDGPQVVYGSAPVLQQAVACIETGPGAAVSGTAKRRANPGGSPPARIAEE